MQNLVKAQYNAGIVARIWLLATTRTYNIYTLGKYHMKLQSKKLSLSLLPDFHRMELIRRDFTTFILNI